MFASRTGWHLQPNSLSQAIEARRSRGLELLDLSESNPTRCGFDYESLQILEALSDPRALVYAPDPRGLLVAREAVAAYYAERGAKVSPEQIFLTTSTSEAYSDIFRLLADTGDGLLIPAPSYPLFDYLGRLNDLEIVQYPLEYADRWQVDFRAMRERVTPRTRAILVVHPNNPTGSFIRRRELDSLVEICSRHSLALIADEVFSDYAFTADDAGDESGPRVLTHAAENRALTFTLSGLSKIAALPQMKLAWLIASGPKALLRDALARLEIITDTYLSVSAPLAYALSKLLDTRSSVQAQVLARVRANLAKLDEYLTKGSAVSRLHVEGGWYAILRLPRTRSDEDWAVRFVSEDGVLAHPGHFFDFAADGFLVVSLLPRAEIFQEGIARILARVANEA